MKHRKHVEDFCVLFLLVNIEDQNLSIKVFKGCVHMQYVIWAFTLFLLGFGWLRFNHFYKDNRKYLIPYLIFQIGVTLFAISLFFESSLQELGLNIIAIMMIGIGLLIALLIYVIDYLNRNDLL